MFMWEKTEWILELSYKFPINSFDKQTSLAEQQATQAGDKVFRNTVALDVLNWLIRSSPAISKPNRFPFVVLLLDFNSVI